MVVRHKKGYRSRIVPPGLRRSQTTRRDSVMQAILIAAESVGNLSKRGQGGVGGYLQYLAVNEPRVFGMLLAQVLRLQGPGDYHETINVQNARKIFMERVEDYARRLKPIEEENGSYNAPTNE